MRRTCFLALTEVARRDPRVVFIGSDISKRDLVGFATEFPERFFSEGIYEGHLISMAAGLALTGKIPYINTIATFLTRRCYEQVLLDLGLHDVPVRLIGSGGGLVYAPLGATHLAVEDFAILRAIPNMTIVSVCDADEMKRLIPLTIDWPHPIYIRLAKGGDPVVSHSKNGFQIGKAIWLREGSDATIISTGVMTQVAIEAAKALQCCGLQVGVLHVHTLKPSDDEAISSALRRTRVTVTLEEHRISGGLGTIVAEIKAESVFDSPGCFKRIGLPDVFFEEHGSQSLILEKYGLSAEKVASTIRDLCSLGERCGLH